MYSGLTYFLAFALGSVFASFFNCIAYRVPRRMNWITGRSICPHCGHVLSFWELVPVVSCIVLRATCLHCGRQFGWGNACTELLLGVGCCVILKVEERTAMALLLELALLSAYLCIALMVGMVSYRKSFKSK